MPSSENSQAEDDDFKEKRLEIRPEITQRLSTGSMAGKNTSLIIKKQRRSKTFMIERQRAREIVRPRMLRKEMNLMVAACQTGR